MNFITKTQGGFPIEIETKISKLITYRLAIFVLNIKNSLARCNKQLLICVSISIGNPAYEY